MGGLQIELTHALLMAVLLAISLVFVFTGGLVTVMVTNFIQGTFFNVFLCIVTAFIFIKVPWSQFATALSQKPPGESMLHPFQTANTKDFNMAFFLITGFQYIYGCMAWQGTQGYFAAASNAHEARMGQVMGFWRTLTQQLMIMILPIGAFVLMHQGYWSANAASVNEQLSTFGNETVRAQVTTTLILNRFLPTVLMGGFCAVMLSAMISTHQTYMHSWGSIFIQDVVMPFRKKPLEPKQHIRLLRLVDRGCGRLCIFVQPAVASESADPHVYGAIGDHVVGRRRCGDHRRFVLETRHDCRGLYGRDLWNWRIGIWNCHAKSLARHAWRR